MQAKLEEIIEELQGGEANKARQISIDEMHARMDEQAERRWTRMQEAAQMGNTDRLWDLITATMEEGLVAYLQKSSKDAMKLRDATKPTS